MEKDDLEFMAEIVERSRWLFYGDLDEYFDGFVRSVFERPFTDYGFKEVQMDDFFATAYWLFLSELVALELAEYGSSPRGAWLTEDGERFKKLCLANEDAIAQTNDFIHNKYNS